MLRSSLRLCPQVKTTLCPSQGKITSKPPHRLLKTSPAKFNQQKEQPVRLHTKIRDSILILEAQHGVLGKTIVGIGQGLFAGGLVFGAGALVYYGLFEKDGHHHHSINSEELEPSQHYLIPGALKVPEYVRDRVHTVYMYVANSLGVSAMGAIASFRLFSSPAFLNAIAANPIAAVGITMGSQFLVTMIVRSLPYKEGFGLKQAGSVVQAALIGLAAAPMYLLGAQSVIRAGFVTAGVIGGLTGISTIVPHNTFVKWESPLRIGMYTVLISFMSLWFVPRGLVIYNLLYRVAMHGGLVVFPAYYLFNSKALLQSAMFAPHFDPINSSMSLYTDVLNIYGRLAFLLPPHYFISGDTSNISWAAQPKSK